MTTPAGLAAAQWAHLLDLETMRRQAAAVRAGRMAQPASFSPEVEAKLAELRRMGKLSDAQETFLRLCGPDEVERQVALARALGALYGGVEVPSRRSMAREVRIQRFVARLRADSAPSRPAVLLSALIGRRLPHRFVRRARRARRVARRTSEGTTPSRGGDPDPDPPAAVSIETVTAAA